MADKDVFFVLMVAGLVLFLSAMPAGPRAILGLMIAIAFAIKLKAA